jgi:hypothetical protein
MTSLKDRMIRAAKLDVDLYEEVEADQGALSQAMLVVALSSVAAGIGRFGQGGLEGMLITIIVAIAECVNKNETPVIDNLVSNAALHGVHRSCLSAN